MGAGCMQLTVHGTTPQGNYWANVFHYDDDGTGASQGIEACRIFTDAWASAMSTSFASVLPHDVSVLGYSTRMVAGTPGPTFVEAVNFVGSRSGNSLAAGICPCIAWYNATYPQIIGHTYLPGVSISDCLEGLYTSGFKTVVSSFIVAAQNPITDADGNTFKLCTLQKPSLARLIVTDGQLQTKPALMNRRLLPLV